MAGRRPAVNCGFDDAPGLFDKQTQEEKVKLRSKEPHKINARVADIKRRLY